MNSHGGNNELAPAGLREQGRPAGSKQYDVMTVISLFNILQETIQINLNFLLVFFSHYTTTACFYLFLQPSSYLHKVALDIYLNLD